MSGQAGLGKPTGGVAPDGFGNSAAESDRRDYNGTGTGPEVAPLLFVPPPVSNEYVYKDDAYGNQFNVRERAPFTLAVATVFRNAEDLLLSKHADYGPKNISLSPGGPLNGLRVRMWDKMARINHLIDSGATPENESLRDSFLDLMNYSAIAQLVLDGDWPQG